MKKKESKKKILALENIDFLKSLCNTDKKSLRNKIKAATSSNINSISEIFHNILKGGLPCSKYKIKKITPYKNCIKTIGNKKCSVKKRRKTINSLKGGWLINILIPAALTAISEIAEFANKNKFEKKNG